MDPRNTNLMALTRYRKRRGTVLPFFLRMKIHTQTLELAPIDSIQPHPENPRRGDVVAIAESIVHNGFYGAVVAQKSTGNILVGNHRWTAAKGTGATEIPCIKIDVTDEDAARIMLADNRTAELGGFDEGQLKTLIDELNDTPGGLSGTGYRQEDLDELFKGLGEGEDPDAKPAGATPLSASADRDKYEVLNVLRWGKFAIHMTDDEVLAMTERYESYVERTGLEFGFVSALLDGTDQKPDPDPEQSDGTEP